MSHLHEVSWIQAYWTASQDPQFTRLCDTDIEELAILLGGLFTSELLWRYDLSKDCINTILSYCRKHLWQKQLLKEQEEYKEQVIFFA